MARAPGSLRRRTGTRGEPGLVAARNRLKAAGPLRGSCAAAANGRCDRRVRCGVALLRTLGTSEPCAGSLLGPAVAELGGRALRISGSRRRQADVRPRAYGAVAARPHPRPGP